MMNDTYLLNPNKPFVPVPNNQVTYTTENNPFTVTAPDDGYFSFSGKANAAGGYVELQDTAAPSILTKSNAYFSNGTAGVFLPVKKGASVQFRWDNIGTFYNVSFVYAESSL